MQDYFSVLAYLRQILNRNYQKFRIFENMMLNLLQTISKHFYLKKKLTVLLFYLFFFLKCVIQPTPW